ncbi:MAG: hypothetical protein J3Q66DRAFT_176058 [Benniella sp.]|nr:MAG: hypothetical protein J3Q66DRAFT_176058 [Benniella sp.]
MARFTTTMTNFPSYTQLVTSRDEAQLRKQATMTFGPQGVTDLAVLGAILGNHIREIGRYKVTCDGQLVQGRYTIYELVHSGALHVTGRRRESRKTHPSRVGGSNTDNNSINNNKDGSHRIPRIYPSTLANIFPALVFKTLRKKSIRPPKFQHRDEDQGDHDNHDTMNDDDDRNHDNLTTLTTPSSLTTGTTSSDPMLITSESVLSSLVQQKLHRVKDLPLPQELCFLGAVSLPLPRALRAMHVAWTMDFLNIRATTTRRQRRQLKTMNTTTAMPTGGLEFRPDIYAHKMRVARLARAHHKTTTSRSMTSSSAGAEDMSIRRHTSIPEENEEDGESLDTASTVQQPMTSTTNSTSHPRSIHRQEKRLIQHLLSLENKVPRTVRQWATAARSCFAEELIQEDRQVQEWVEHQRAQVVLGYGGHYTPATMATHGSNGRNNTNGSLFARRRPVLSPISTTLANSIHYYNATGLNKSPLSAKRPTAPKAVPRVRETAAIPIPASRASARQSLLSTARSSLPEGGAARLGTSPRAVWGGGSSAQALFDQTLTCSGPTSAIALPSPISATQMLSMHLYLTLLVSPLSPEYMVQDLGRLDS